MDETNDARTETPDHDGAQILRPTPAFIQAALERAKASTEKRRKHDWCTLLERTERGDARPTSANALIALQNAEELEGIVAVDEMEDATMLMRELPSPMLHENEETTQTAYPRMKSDTDVTSILVWIQRNGIPTMNYDALHKAISLDASRMRFNPVQEWLNNLKWDGQQRLDTFLPVYFGSDDNAYTRDVGRKFLIAMVARAMKPGCKMDYMLVLEGKQGLRKSTACEILGGPWFSDNLPDLRHGGKDVSQHIKGKWLIEVGEMSATDKADANVLKSFMTRTTERYRPSYGRNDIKQPRQCVFIGTTNKQTYLRDETGGRRFWPVKVGKRGILDTEALARDRDNLFAEALIAWKAGEPYWPSQEEQEKLYAPEQEGRHESDEWEPIVVAWLMDKQHAQIRLLDIAEHAFDIKPKDLGTSQTRRITAILEKNGWEKKRVTQGSRWILPHK